MSGTSLEYSLAISPSPTREGPPDLESAKEKLLSFDPLSAEDINDIQPHLSRAEAEINKYSAEIDGLSRLLHLLAKEKDELEAKKGDLERIRAGVLWRCAPISRLVPDILTEIFCLVRDACEYSLRDYKSAILPLAQTCRLWRHVSFSQPLLWASIGLHHDMPFWPEGEDPSFDNRVARAVGFHLEKSGNALLSVCIECDNCPACDDLLAVRHRWRECRTLIFSDASVVRLQQAYYPSLEHLELELFHAAHAFEDSPRLRSYSGPIFDTHLPWRQLARLSIMKGIPSSDLLASVLREGSRLEYLKFDLSSIAVQRRSTIATRITFHLPMLRQLVVTCWDWKEIVSRVLLCVVAPALESLELCVVLESDILVGVADVLQEFLSRCVALRALTLKNVPLYRRDLHRVLEYVANVERLVWWDLGHCTSADLLRILSPPPLPHPMPDDVDDLFEDSVLPCPNLGDDEVRVGNPLADDNYINGFEGTVLPRLTYLEISGGLSPFQQVELLEHMLVSRALRRDRTTDVTPLRHVILELLDECALDDSTRGRMSAMLGSLTIREDVDKGRGIFAYEESESDEQPLPLSTVFPNPRPPTVLIPNPTTSFQALLPELELCIKISGVSWDIGRLVYKIRSRVVDAHPKGTLPEPGQTCLRRLADYVTCAADTILAYHEIFRGIRVAITSTDTSLDSDVLAIYERYDDFLRMQDVLASLEGPVMQSLHGLGEYVIQEFSYPPGIHFFVMRVLGPDSWGCREIALQEVPPLLDASRTCLKQLKDLAAQLRMCAGAMRTRFSLVRLSEIRALTDEVRGKLDLLVVRASGDLPSLASSIRSDGRIILELTMPRNYVSLSLPMSRICD
ncbi:hypothetical protein GGG16DRAFT_66820 [Schizophyllum commune]